MGAQEDYERLEKALLEIENGLEPPRPRSRKDWTPRNEYRRAFRAAIQQFWQSTWSIAGVDEKTTTGEAFWDGDDPQHRHAVVVWLDRRLWSLGFIGGHTLLKKVYPSGAQMSGRKDWDSRPRSVSARDIDTFTDGYLRAAIHPFLTGDETPEFEERTLGRMRSDAKDFVTKYWPALRESIKVLSPEDPSREGFPAPHWIQDAVTERSGGEFWYARNRPTEQFWVISYPNGEWLTERAREYGPYSLYDEDDGLIHGRAGQSSSLSGRRKDWDPRRVWTQMDFGMFVNSYMNTALWAEMDEEGRPLDEGRTFTSIAPDTRRKMERDSAEFMAKNWELIKENPGRAGHDFWLTRNGHGAGFWDGDWPKEAGELLTKRSEEYGEVTLIVGDDNQIYAL